MYTSDKRARVGILGGMGPAATADFYRKLVEATPAARDQDHIPVLMEADPRVPDRSDCFLHGGASPLPWLCDGAQALQQRGAALVVMPCNTAHLWYDALAPRLDIPVLHIVDAVVDDLLRQFGAKAGQPLRIGLLATAATAAGSLYPGRAARHPRARQWQWLLPDAHGQALVQAGIAAVKAAQLARAEDCMAAACNGLVARGVDAVVYACTEVPLAMRGMDAGVPSCDSTAALAHYTVRRAMATA